MTDSEDVLRAALEAAGLSLQAIPEEQRTSLTEEEVTRLIGLCARPPAREPVRNDTPAVTDSGTSVANSDA